MKTYTINCRNFVSENTTNQYHTKRMEGSPDDQNTTNNDAVKRYSRHCSQI